MRKLLFIPFIIGIGIFFNSCNIEDTGNISTFPNVPAVVGYNPTMGGSTIATPFGILSAPSINDCFPDDCVLLKEFTVDFDNQPSKNYLTATNISKEKVDMSYFIQTNSFDIGDHTLPITSLEGVSSEFYHGKIFILALTKDKTPNLRMVYNTEEEEMNGVKNLYLLAQASSSTQNSTDYSTLTAIDLLDFIYLQGRDTTITVSGSSEKAEYKYAKVNIKYISSISGDIPTFKDATADPFMIYVSKD